MPNNRIHSIDVLRGFDMLMIVFTDQFFSKLHQGSGSGFTAAIAQQFQHPEWFGFRFYDIIMPLFLFVVGAVIPFSLKHRLQKNAPKKALFQKIAQAFCHPFFSGVDCSGEPAGLWLVRECHMWWMEGSDWPVCLCSNQFPVATPKPGNSRSFQPIKRLETDPVMCYSQWLGK